jgi:hypothetical protein
MKLEIDDKGQQILKEVYNTIGLRTNAGETLYISMRDSGFEFTYGGQSYEAKEWDVKLLGYQPTPLTETIRKAINNIPINNGTKFNQEASDVANELRYALTLLEMGVDAKEELQDSPDATDVELVGTNGGWISGLISLKDRELHQGELVSCDSFKGVQLLVDQAIHPMYKFMVYSDNPNVGIPRIHFEPGVQWVTDDLDKETFTFMRL